MTLWTNAGRTEVRDDMGGSALQMDNWPTGLTIITQAEADVILNPPEKQRAAIKSLIDSMEREQLLSRVTREGLLMTMETFAAMQGITPAQLYATNIAYHRTKDFDTQITLLRAQL
jgi:hypothetical protein